VIVLGIESSCDETAAAVVEDGRRILSSVVSSQIVIHRPYGGVVPELASRQHLKVIVPVISEALQRAGVDLPDVDAIAVTQGPGLVGSLLVGVGVAKGLAYATGKPLVAVNHLEGHILAAFLEDSPPSFPAIALVVSGGHTNLYHVKDYGDITLVGRTRDDAAGEAFDKVAKFLDLGVLVCQVCCLNLGERAEVSGVAAWIVRVPAPEDEDDVLRALEAGQLGFSPA